MALPAIGIGVARGISLLKKLKNLKNIKKGKAPKYSTVDKKARAKLKERQKNTKFVDGKRVSGGTGDGAVKRALGTIFSGKALTKEALKGAKAGVTGSVKAAPAVARFGGKALDRATGLGGAALIYGGSKLYDKYFGDDPAEAGGSGTEGTTSQGGATRPLPFTPSSAVNNLIITELLKQRGKTGDPQEAAKQADPEINDRLRDQIFGEQTDDRSFAELMKDPKFSGDKAGATTAKPTTRSRPSPDSPLSYLRTDDEVEARNLSVQERMGKEQRGRRLDAEARFRERKDFMEQSKKLKDPNLIEGPQGEVLGRVIKDSTGRIIGSSLNKAGRAAMGNRKGAGVIDGSMRDTALGLDKRDEQIAGMVAAQKDVADMFYSKSGGSRGSGATPAPTATAVNTGAAPKATAVNTGEPVVTFGSSSQYNSTSKSSPTPRAIPVDKGYVEGQGGYGLPAPDTTDVADAPKAIPVAPRAIPVNTPAPRAIPVAPRATAVKPSAPSDVALGNQFGSMDMNPPNNPSISPPSKSNKPPNIPVDRIGSVVPANVTADSYNWAEVEKNMPAGSTDTPPTTMSRNEYPFDEKGNYDEAAASNKKPTVATVVTNLLKKKKK